MRYLALLFTLFLAAPAAHPQPAPEAIRVFADGAVPDVVDSAGAPGAVFVVVLGDSVVVQRGYGWADVAAGRPMDVSETVVRVGSVSKLVTATAVMQLWERGALDLGADVNASLGGVRVPEAFGEPVTPHDLLTHTAGFDERLLAAGTPGQPPPLVGYLRRTLPDRVYPPGLLHSYSNHGYGLLGALVERVSGVAFERYAEEHVFAPLGMTRSTFRQPPPVDLRGALATGYARTPAGAVPLPPDYVAFAPAGALYTTGADMARFMAAHLGGRGADMLLADTTRRAMHARQWTPHPALAGMGYGFFRGTVAGHPSLRHRGGWPGWVAQVILVPDLRLGLFIAANADAPAFLDAVEDRFVAEVLGYLPPAPLAARSLSDYVADGFAGTYRLARHPHRSADKLALFSPMMPYHLRVAAADSALVLAVGGERVPLREVETGVWAGPGPDPTRFFFETDASGRAVRLHTSTASFERIGWVETLPVQAALFGGCLALFASAVMAWGAGRFRTRGRRGPLALRRARGLVALAGALHLAFVAILAGSLVALGPQGIFYPFPLALKAAFALPTVAAVLGLAAVPAAVILWRRGLGSVAGRLHYSAVAVAAVVVVPLLAYWNLLGVWL
ncbi:MAG: serine hydrolase domain-containing protein [Rhodothermales bacterium]